MQPPDAIPTTLAPERFSAGGVIARTFSTWSRNLVPFVLLSLVTNAPNFLYTLWTQYAILGGYPESGRPFFGARARMAEAAAAGGASFAGEFVVATVVVWVLTVALTLVQMGALTYGGIQHLAGRKVTFGALVGMGIQRAWAVFLTGLLAALIWFAGTILLVIPGIIAACALVASVPAVVAEPGSGAIAAVKRSFTLTKGHRFEIFATSLVMFVVAWVAAMIAGFLPLVLGGGAASLVGACVGLLVTSLATPLWTLLPAVVYHDLRVEKEGVDTAELAKVFE